MRHIVISTFLEENSRLYVFRGGQKPCLGYIITPFGVNNVANSNIID